MKRTARDEVYVGITVEVIVAVVVLVALRVFNVIIGRRAVVFMAG